MSLAVTVVNFIRKKMAKKKSRSAVVKELDRVFSLFIRHRNADDEGFVTCITCGRSNHLKKMQCGHFMSRAKYATRWNETNCQVQCYGCNVMQQGQQYKFSVWLDANIELGTANEMVLLSNTTVKFSTPELLEKIEYYKSKLD